MRRLVFAPAVAGDLVAIAQQLRRYEVESAPERIEALLRALDVLLENPEIGRPTAGGHRELVIGRRASGYLALYRYVPAVETVFVLALRHQREAGYR